MCVCVRRFMWVLRTCVCGKGEVGGAASCCPVLPLLGHFPWEKGGAPQVVAVTCLCASPHGRACPPPIFTHTHTPSALQAKEFQIRHLHGKLIAREIGALVRRDRSAEAAAAEEKMVTLAVEGNISAGKSTFLDVLSHEETNLRDMLQAGSEGEGAGARGGWWTSWKGQGAGV